MNTYISLSSLAMDLKRVALAAHRNSNQMSDHFLEEALKRRDEIDPSTLKPYVKTLLEELDTITHEKDIQQKAEHVLLLSTLFQNASLMLKNS